ncbi:MAG: TolC family protein [Lachnospiraceae bacterium]|nr:TolC family protein [Lachnospiraceae bacterium]
MKTFKKAFIVVFGACLIFSGTASAASPEFARTQEEWAVLRDNVLTYEEIPSLVKEYNATVQKNAADYDVDNLKLKNAEQTNDELIRMADEYDSMAIDAESVTGGAITAASYRMLSDQLRSQAEENTSDYRVLLLQYDRAEAEIVKTVRELFINRYKLELRNNYNNQNLAYLQRAYNSARNKAAYGAGTQLEELTALQALQTAQASQITDAAELSADYKKLITLCGWQYDAAAEIGPMPPFDIANIAMVDKAMGTENALNNSFTIKTDEIKLENARQMSSGTVIQKCEAQLNSDRITVRTAVTSAYDSLQLAKATYDSLCAIVTVQAGSLATAARQLNLGVISQFDYVTAENAYNKAVYNRDASLYDLILARIDYDAVIDGLG